MVMAAFKAGRAPPVSRLALTIWEARVQPTFEDDQLKGMITASQ